MRGYKITETERKTEKPNAKSKERFIAVDVETTGLSPMRGDRVIEIGAVIVESGAAAQEFHMLVNAGKRISMQAIEVHGITNELLMNEPGPEEAFPLFRAFIGDSILIAHNAEFDMRFLRHEFSRLGMALNNEHHCTMKMSRRRCPDLRNHRLETVYRHVVRGGIATQQTHRALDDARMVARVWMEMMKQSA